MQGRLGVTLCAALAVACVRFPEIAAPCASGAPTPASPPAPTAQVAAQPPAMDPWLALDCPPGATAELLRSGERVFGAHCRDARGKDHGITRTLHAGGGHELEARYAHGLLHGESRRWFHDGTLSARDTYAAGRLHGSSERFYEDGGRSSLQTYAHGTLDGPVKMFARSGIATWEGTYRDGLRHGPFVMRSEDGALRVEGAYRDGVPDGVFRRLDAEGHELARFEIRDGTGDFEELQPDGPSRARGRLVKGQRSGPWRELTPEGAGYQDATYLDGLLDGVFVRWDDARKSEETRYVRGERQGRSRRWFWGTTQLRVDAVYRDGKLDGPYRAFDEHGAVILEGAFARGVPDGKWTRYFASGKPMERLEAKRGVLVGRFESLRENGQSWRSWDFDASGRAVRADGTPGGACVQGRASWLSDDLRADVEPCRDP